MIVLTAFLKAIYSACLIAAFVPLVILVWKFTQKASHSCTVLVFGDLNHSPRILNHVKSLLQAGFKVDLIGYAHEPPLENTNLTIHKLKQPAKLPRDLLGFITNGIVRVLGQLYYVLFLVVLKIPKSKFIVVQNPPSIPTLILIQLATFLTHSKLIIDWHNYGWSILHVNGSPNVLVQCAKIYETIFGSCAFLHITVTEAMAQDLGNRVFLGSILTLYDKPSKDFKPLTEAGKLNFLKHCIFDDLNLSVFNSSQENIFVKLIGRNKFQMKPDRPFLIVSSTSWTKDEDFSILFDALKIYDTQAKEKALPKICLVITGKGPMREYYLEYYSKLGLVNVTLFTAWLKITDYPTLLACADLGVSLHTSSSSLDLPMKIVDMFGAGVPVLAKNFSCISELLISGENGQVFETSEQLYQLIVGLLQNFPDIESIQELKRGVEKFRAGPGWEELWEEILLPSLRT